MGKELNCTNCSIGDFKHELCDCDSGFCKEFKSIGNQEDFFNAVVQRIRPQGEWVHLVGNSYRCSNCNEYTKSEKPFHKPKGNYCPNCGAKMKGAADGR